MNIKQVNTLRLVTRISAASTLANSKQKVFAACTRSVKSAATVAVALGLMLGTTLTFASSAPVSAAACATPAQDLGTLTLNINIPAAATYTIWSRIMAPDTTNNSINLQVDSSDCFNVGGGSIAANSWTWVNYQNGTTSSYARLSLTAGNHTLKYIGTKAGLSLDRVIVTSDSSCTPTDMGNNCQAGDSTPPTVNITAPTNNQAVSGTVPISAAASDTGGSGVKDVQFLVDGQVVNTDTTSPYSYNWNAASVANGSHTLTARATDNANNVATSTAVTVTVSGGGTQKQGDLNGDGKVNITDLSILLTNWGKTGIPASQGDINSNGKVDITDLSILLSKWG